MLDGSERTSERASGAMANDFVCTVHGPSAGQASSFDPALPPMVRCDPPLPVSGLAPVGANPPGRDPSSRSFPSPVAGRVCRCLESRVSRPTPVRLSCRVSSRLVKKSSSACG